MKAFPFLSSKHALILLRVAIAVMFMAHAGVRVMNGTIPRFAGFMENLGFPYGMAWVWAITLFELIGGTLLIMGQFSRWMAAGFMLISGMGIVLIHAAKGWFVGEHGAGGAEYSIVLFVACVVLAAVDREHGNTVPVSA
jgi:putative oxidoreductase